MDSMLSEKISQETTWYMLTYHIITDAYRMYEFTYTAFSKGQNIEIKSSVVARGYHELPGWRQYECGFF